MGSPFFCMKAKALKIRVECYAGTQADERPTKFYIKERPYRVVKLIDKWYEPRDTYYKVRAEDGNYYVLKHCHEGQEDWWELSAYRKNP
ncbi:MAG: cytoplasmic protein [bacterium]|nr:cytoplasmic protein [bacterium]